MLYTITQCLIKLIRLSLELITQTLLQFPQVCILFLQTSLNCLSLLLSIFIILNILLEFSYCILQRAAF